MIPPHFKVEKTEAQNNTSWQANAELESKPCMLGPALPTTL